MLITGASAGIGREMALQLAALNYNVVLVARRLDKLEQLRNELSLAHGIEVEVIAEDLSNPQTAIRLHAEIKARGWTISHLVNNAGFGGYGEFIETSLAHELNMINLNVSSLVVLTKLFAQDMALRKSGRIMNVASLLSFIPFPYYAVYSASKTFVLAFTETIAAELEGTGVVVTALCPGTVETAFHTPAMRQTNAMSANKPVAAADVAKAGVKLLLHGKGKRVVGFNNWFISNLPRFTPDRLMMRIKKNLASQKA